MTGTVRWSIAVGVALVTALLGAAPCGAQYPITAMEAGARIRVLRSGDHTLQEATLVSFDHDTLIMEVGGCCTRDTIPAASIAAVDVSRGRSVDPGRVLGGMTWGLLAGVSAGWLAGQVGCRLSEGNELCALGAVKWSMILGAGGLLAGALWGTEGNTERWERIYPPDEASLLMAPAPHGGFAIGVTIPLDVGSAARTARGA